MNAVAVIDTNVLVSALLKWDSVPGKILNAIFEGDVIPVYNEEILNEYQIVLSREKFHFSKDKITEVLYQIRILGIPETELVHVIESMPDPKDVVFYSIALAHGRTEKTHLVTGNIKHFPSSPIVMSPRDFVEKVLGFPLG